MGKLRKIHAAGLTGIAVTLLGAAPHAWTQPADSIAVPQMQGPLTQADLSVLVGPIALYADDLVGIVLPAATYPLQVVQARRFLDQLESEPSLQPDPDWDSSVVALLNYPEILRMMDTNIEWTWSLGEAVIGEQAAVLDAIQFFRQQALQAGNLASNAQQTVTQTDNLIEIAPAEPEVIHVPYYEPERVVVVQPQPVIHYYPDPYPLYYYPYPVGYRFRTGFFWGVTTAFNLGWHSHSLHVYHHLNALHPYYGFTYYNPWYARRGVNININVNRVNSRWQSTYRRAARPTRTVNRNQISVSTEGRGSSRSTAVTRSTRINTAPSATTRRTTNGATTRSTTATRSATNTRSGTATRSATTTRSSTRAPGVTSRQQSTRTPSFASPRSNSRTAAPLQRSGSSATQTPARTRTQVPAFTSPQRSAPSSTSRPRTSVQTSPTTRSRQPSTFGGSSASRSPSISSSSRSSPQSSSRSSSISRSSGRSGGAARSVGGSTRSSGGSTRSGSSRTR